MSETTGPNVPLAYRPENRQDATRDLVRILTQSAGVAGNVTLPREAINNLLAELRDQAAKLAKVEALADEWAALGPEGDWAEGGMADTVLSDAGRAIRAALGDKA